MRLLDANIFLRYLARDEPDKTRACERLFDRIRRDEEVVVVSEATVAEVVHVLSSRSLYGMSRQEIAERLSFLLEQRSLRLLHKSRCLRALGLYAERGFLDFADALMVAYSEADDDISEIYSYDRDFERVDGVVRVEP